jgi:hypothetical protein
MELREGLKLTREGWKRHEWVIVHKFLTEHSFEGITECGQRVPFPITKGWRAYQDVAVLEEASERFAR